MRDYLGFVIITDNQLCDKLHGWIWTWDPSERSTAFGLDVVGCWVSRDPKGSYRRMPPWSGSHGFVPTPVQLAKVIAERGIGT